MERFGRHATKSRSQLFSEAVPGYISRQSPEHVTAAMGRVYAVPGDQADAFVSSAAQRTLKRSEW
jgi:hypothetical protein